MRVHAAWCPRRAPPQQNGKHMHVRHAGEGRVTLEQSVAISCALAPLVAGTCDRGLAYASSAYLAFYTLALRMQPVDQAHTTILHSSMLFACTHLLRM